jgi:leucyl/phenylalanyl-tRNA--protein transferase
MPIFVLEDEPFFPPPELASKEGIIAVGGDLSPERLLNAYKTGIFPWYSEGEPILWWSPNPRLVLFPEDLRVSQSMKKFLKNTSFHLTVDNKFVEVIDGCRAPRRSQANTWITPAMRAAYIELHQLGFAHSVEVFSSEELVGGLYGVSLGKCFFGESMFSAVSNSSKLAFIKLVQALAKEKFLMVDCQVPSEHLKRLGAKEIPRNEFLDLLKKGLQYKTITGNWGFLDLTE